MSVLLPPPQLLLRPGQHHLATPWQANQLPTSPKRLLDRSRERRLSMSPNGGHAPASWLLLKSRIRSSVMLPAATWECYMGVALFSTACWTVLQLPLPHSRKEAGMVPDSRTPGSCSDHTRPASLQRTPSQPAQKAVPTQDRMPGAVPAAGGLLMLAFSCCKANKSWELFVCPVTAPSRGSRTATSQAAAHGVCRQKWNVVNNAHACPLEPLRSIHVLDIRC
jgi:hypothetical protein